MAELATIARPYAEALYKVVGDNSADSQDWLDALAQIAADEDVKRLTNSPNVSREQLKEIFLSTLSQKELPQFAASFLDVVIENRRLLVLPEIAAQFRILVNAQSGAADAIIYSAFPISDEELPELKSVLEKRFARKLNVTQQQDESLIGGIRVVVGDEELDTSVKARLQQMKHALTA